jgi:hypothetical protein
MPHWGVPNFSMPKSCQEVLLKFRFPESQLGNSKLIQESVCLQKQPSTHDNARAHKGGVRIGKTPKKLASICCP